MAGHVNLSKLEKGLSYVLILLRFISSANSILFRILCCEWIFIQISTGSLLFEMTQNCSPNEIAVQRLNLEPDTSRERSQSAANFEHLSIMDNTLEISGNDKDYVHPSSIQANNKVRSHSLTPEPVRRSSNSETLDRSPYRPKIKRGQTIDTPRLRKAEHEVSFCCTNA